MVTRLLRTSAALGIDRISLNFAVFRSVFERSSKLGAGPALRLWYRTLLLTSRCWLIESLYRANAKYQPTWQPRSICFPAFAISPGSAPPLSAGKHSSGCRGTAPDQERSMPAKPPATDELSQGDARNHDAQQRLADAADRHTAEFDALQAPVRRWRGETRGRQKAAPRSRQCGPLPGCPNGGIDEPARAGKFQTIDVLEGGEGS